MKLECNIMFLSLVKLLLLIISLGDVSTEQRSVEERVDFFDSGEKVNDEILQTGQPYGVLNLQTPIFNDVYQIYINENGILGLGKYVPRAVIPSKEKFIAVYHKNTIATDSSHISYRETNDSAILALAKEHVVMTYDRDFVPVQAIIVTFNDISDRIHREKRFQYQAVLISNTKDVYLQLNFRKLETSGATSGYSLDDTCKFDSFAPVTTSERLQSASNVGRTGLHIFHLTSESCSHTGFYKHGEIVGDKYFTRGDDSYVKLTLQHPMPLFSSKFKEVFISVNGIITTQKPPSAFIQNQIPNKHHAFIAPLSVDMDISNSGTITYRQTNDRQTLLWASKQISRFKWSRFIAKQAVVVTYLGVPVKESHHLMSFQTVLASNDDDETYLISFYKWHAGIHDTAVMGYSNKMCDWNWFKGNGDSMKSTFLYTNTGFMGQYIYPVTSKKCISNVFFPYGETKGDSSMKKGDDAAVLLNLQRPFPFFTKTYRNLYVSVNSIISVNKPTSYSSHTLFLDNTLLVVIYKDFSIKDGGSIQYREVSAIEDLNLYSQRIKEKTSADVMVTHALIVTYLNIQEVGVESSRYSFQVVLANTDNNGVYGIINYYRVAADEGGTSGYVDPICPVARQLAIPSKKDIEETNSIQVVKFTQCVNYTSNFLPYDRKNGSDDVIIVMKRDEQFKKIQLQQPLKFFHNSYSNIYIGMKGVISFDQPILDNQVSIPYDVTPILAAYSIKMTNTAPDSNIYIQQTTNRSYVSKIAVVMTSFKPVNTIVITYDSLASSDNIEFKNIFQVILTYNESVTYAVLIYDKLDSQDATVGYSAPGCHWKLLTTPGVSSSMSSSTNVKQMGTHVYMLHSPTIQCSPYKGFYQYGKFAGDRSIPSGEKSMRVLLPYPMPFLGLKTTKELWVSDAGLVSMHAATWNQISLLYLQRFDVLALFGTRYFDLELGGEIFARATTDSVSLKQINSDISMQTKTVFTATQALIATFILVPTPDLKRHTFQVAIATNQIQTFAVINYRQLESESAIVNVSDRVCRRVDLTVVKNSELLNGGNHGQHVIQLTPYKNCKMKVYPTFKPTTLTSPPPASRFNTVQPDKSESVTTTQRLQISQPVVISEPSQKIHSVKSLEPTQMIYSVKSSEPSQKIHSVKTSEPSQKTHTVKSSEPSQKTNTVKTSEPSQKTHTVKSSEPSQKTNTVKTSAPSQTLHQSKKTSSQLRVSITRTPIIHISPSIAASTPSLVTATIATPVNINSSIITKNMGREDAQENTTTQYPYKLDSNIKTSFMIDITSSSLTPSVTKAVQGHRQRLTSLSPTTVHMTPSATYEKITHATSTLISTNNDKATKTKGTSLKVTDDKEEETHDWEKEEEEGENEDGEGLFGGGGGGDPIPTGGEDKTEEGESFYFQGIIIGSCVLGIPVIALIVFVVVRYRQSQREKRRLRNREAEKFLANNNSSVENSIAMHNIPNMY